MSTFWKTISGAAATLLTWLGYLVGGWDAVLGVMFAAMLLDYITGVATAALGLSGKTADGRFSSSAAFAGLTKKMMMLVVVMLAVQLDRLLGTQGISRMMAIGFYAANEGLSIIENCSALGVPFPGGLLRALEKMRKRHDEDEVQ